MQFKKQLLKYYGLRFLKKRQLYGLWKFSKKYCKKYQKMVWNLWRIKYLRPRYITQFFITFFWLLSQDTRRPRNKKKSITFKSFRCIFLRENSCLNCLKIVRTKDYKNKTSIRFFYFVTNTQIHKPLWRVRRGPFLHLADAQSTGLVWPRLPS